MNQSIGRQLGPYRILAPLGAGGMGDVYRARDTKLGRDVAIKTLPPHFTNDPDRRARLEREARTLATLNHPHVGAIYGLEKADGVSALVLELVEGATLAQRLERGPLKRSEALTIAHQIADALEAAHEKGIVHRDLKPANVVLTGRSTGSSGDVRVKVLDFGIAKFVDGNGEPLRSTTLQTTEDGRILGTPAYMSPEQARGQMVDRRTDIWAFGCVLFEMLSGRRPFTGDTLSDTFVSVLDREPDWTSLPADTPVFVRTLLRRCLRKDPRQRLHDIADVRIELEEAAPDAPAASPPPRTSRLGWLVAAALGLAFACAFALDVVRLRGPLPAVDPSEFAIAPPDTWSFTGPGTGSAQLAVSPDGRQLAFVAFSQGVEHLWVRPLDTIAARVVPGSDRARNPFWSPDSRSIAFFAGGKLKKVPAEGGEPVDLCEAPSGLGGAWNRDNVIVFAPSTVGPLQSVSSAGGVPTTVSTLAQGDASHRWPSFLPDGRHFFYLAQRGTSGTDGSGGQPAAAVPRPPDATDLRLTVLGSTETTSFGAAESGAVHASGHVLLIRGGSLIAQPFDPESRRTTGDAFPIAAVATASSYRNTFSVSASGVRAYSSGQWLSASQPTWMDRSGKPLGIVGDAGAYVNVSLSPDERRVAVSLTTGLPPNRDIWLIDLARADTPTRLTVDSAMDTDPIWSPDGRQIVFASQRVANQWVLLERAADGSGQDTLLLRTEGNTGGPDWSRDGHYLVYSERSTATNTLDIWVLPSSGDRKPFVFMRTPFNEGEPALSPDGRWIAYRSDSSGRDEIHIRSFPKPGGDFRISRNGGWAPRWRDDGSEVFFLGLDQTMMAAGIKTVNGVQAAVPQALFQTGMPRDFSLRPYAVTADGQRFLIPRPSTRQPRPITLLLNFPASVRK